MICLYEVQLPEKGISGDRGETVATTWSGDWLKGMRRSLGGWQCLYLHLWVVSGAYTYVKVH